MEEQALHFDRNSCIDVSELLYPNITNSKGKGSASNSF